MMDASISHQCISIGKEVLLQMEDALVVAKHDKFFVQGNRICKASKETKICKMVGQKIETGEIYPH